MRAILCRSFGPPESLVLEEVAAPLPGVGEVLVDVAAVGLNFTDLLAIEGQSQLRRNLPFIPGIEVSGRISTLGEGVTGFMPGQAVIGHRISGGFAEQAVFDADEIYAIPDSMNLVHAAAFSIASTTAQYALIERGALKAGETLLVLGAGSGAGLAAVEIGKILGARVVAAASSQDKLDLALDRGADEAILYSREALDKDGQKALYVKLTAASGALSALSPMHSIGVISTLSRGKGYEVIYDAVGGTYAEPALRSLAWQGRYLSVGFSAGVPAPSLGALLFKNARIEGIQPTSDDQRRLGRKGPAMEQLFGWYNEGRLRPQITATFPLARAAQALRQLKDRKALGRVVLIVDPRLVGTFE
jgi:NADPH2:quinone reductase